MKPHLLDLFHFTNWANTKLLDTIKQLPEKGEALALFSHLIYSQDKWMNRITKRVEDAELKWQGTAFAVEEIGMRWEESVGAWIALLNEQTEESLLQPVRFQRASDGKMLSVQLGQLMLQLNYHSIHHRAQINKLISAQGIAVPATDYIFTVLKEEE